MTTSKPEVVKYIVPKHEAWDVRTLVSPKLPGEQLMVLASDYEALQAECEQLRKAAEVSAADANDAERELETVKAERDLLRAAIRRLCNIYVVDDYYMGKQREERLGEAIELAIEKVRENQK